MAEKVTCGRYFFRGENPLLISHERLKTLYISLLIFFMSQQKEVLAQNASEYNAKYSVFDKLSDSTKESSFSPPSSSDTMIISSSYKLHSSLNKLISNRNTVIKAASAHEVRPTEPLHSIKNMPSSMIKKFDMENSSITLNSITDMSKAVPTSSNSLFMTSSEMAISSSLTIQNSSIPQSTNETKSSVRRISTTIAHQSLKSSMIASTSNLLISSVKANSTVPVFSARSLIPESSVCIVITTICFPINITTATNAILHTSMFPSSVSNSSLIISQSLLHSSMISPSLSLILNSTAKLEISSSIRSTPIITTIPIKVENMSLTTVHVQSSRFITQPPTVICDSIGKILSGAMNNLTSCVLTHLRPMMVCAKCIDYYDAFTSLHKVTFVTCGKTLIHNVNEQYQVVPKLYQDQINIWNTLGCEKCYDQSSVKPKPSEAFKNFKKLYAETKKCFKNNSISTDHNTTRSQRICSNCRILYEELQKKFKYYKGEETATAWCADINVAVNATRNLWGRTYKCGSKKRDPETIIALTCFFCFLPIIFYVGAKLHSDVKERKTNRMYESD